MRTMARFLLVTTLLLLPVAALAADAGKGENGFYIADGDFTLNTEFRVQVVGTWIDPELDLSGNAWNSLGYRETDADSRTDFSIPRARIGFFGQAFYPWLKYRVTMDFGEGESDLMDAWVRLDFSDGNKWTFGQFKALFDWFELVDSKYQVFTYRPWGTRIFAPARDVGIMYSGHSESGQVSWGLAIQNGNGDNTPGNDNDEFLTTARIAVQNEGGFAPRAATFERPDGFQWIFGISYLNNPVGGLVDPDSDDCEIGSSSRCRYETRDINAWEAFGAVRSGGLDLDFTWQAWSLEDQAVDRHGSTADYEFTYWNIDGGYFVTPSWQVVARYGQWETDKPYSAVTSVIRDYLGDGWADWGIASAGTPGPVSAASWDQQVTEWRIGFNHFFGSDNFKLQFDYGEVETEYDGRFDASGQGKWTDTDSQVTLSVYFWI